MQACRYNGASEREDSDGDGDMAGGEAIFEEEAMRGVGPPPAMLEDDRDLAIFSDGGEDGHVEYTCERTGGIGVGCDRAAVTPFLGLLLLVSLVYIYIYI